MEHGRHTPNPLDSPHMDDPAPLIDPLDPCRPCGACCAVLRIHFPLSDGPRVPAHLVDPTIPDHARMKRRSDGACVGLDGEPGRATRCVLYVDRPDPCRAFQPSTAAEVNPYCDDARARIHLPPLR